jgi:DNA-binding transcriptional LysR family regulator
LFSVLSKSIRELEREMDVALLERSAKGATLTLYGATVVKRSRAIQKEIVRMQEEIDSLQGGLGARLSIGLTLSAAGAPLAKAIAAFQRRRPTAELHLVELRLTQVSQGLHYGTRSWVGRTDMRSSIGCVVGVSDALFCLHGLDRDRSVSKGKFFA